MLRKTRDENALWVIISSLTYRLHTRWPTKQTRIKFSLVLGVMPGCRIGLLYCGPKLEYYEDILSRGPCVSFLQIGSHHRLRLRVIEGRPTQALQPFPVTVHSASQVCSFSHCMFRLSYVTFRFCRPYVFLSLCFRRGCVIVCVLFPYVIFTP